MSSTEIAAAMVAYIRSAGCALQIEVADHLEERYGQAAVYIDEMSGNRRIRRSVLDRFNSQKAAAGIAWNRHILGWELEGR
ncbi:DUF6953 family protein [Tsukamurella pseudospumae]|uniref:Uncharacterized protein n=1 Tax=Tsukamurella pseudospumae TaxID=239498 RepID=A0A138AED4_9ACTN|nr:hypothetical protein [Tsukamurella pseudospumae]KXP08824.1 hypothetical protein AXK60_09180 [Tsukamurella pseudospumae]